MTDEFSAIWSDTGVGIRRSLELAHASLVARGLPVGAVLLDADGTIVAEGRNRAYDPSGGPDRLQGSPIAHAEMNALAAVGTSTDLNDMTLWSSHRPCAMCAAACAFTEVGAVRFVAPDPSDPADRSDPDRGDQRWLVVANLLFLAGVRAYSGGSAPMFAHAREHEPEVSRLLDSIDGATLYAPTLQQSLAPIWMHIVAAAQERDSRVR